MAGTTWNRLTFSARTAKAPAQAGEGEFATRPRSSSRPRPGSRQEGRWTASLCKHNSAVKGRRWERMTQSQSSPTSVSSSHRECLSLLAASSFQSWFPKALSCVSTVCGVNQFLICCWVFFFFKVKQKIPLSPVFLQTPTGPPPPCPRERPGT